MPLELSQYEIFRRYGEFKRRAYAGNGKYNETPYGTLLFVDQRDDWIFRDEFAGDWFFHGIEQMSKICSGKQLPVVGMTYRGGIRQLLPGMKKEKVYDFLRVALSAMPEDRPFRGPITRIAELHGVRDPSFEHSDFPNLEYRNVPEWEEYWLGSKIMKLPVSSGGTETIKFRDTPKSHANIYIGWWHFGLLMKDLGDILLL